MNALLRRCRGAILLVPFLLLAQCDEDGGNPASPAPRRSVDLAVGAPFAGTLAADSSRDTLRATFLCDAGTTCELQVPDTLRKLSVRVLDTVGAKVFVLDASYSPKTHRLQLPCTRSGVYVLEISGPGGTRVAATLGVTPGYPQNFVLPDAFEPDGDLSKARRVQTDSVWTRRTLHSGSSPDVDWFAAALDSGWTYTFQRADSGRLYASSASAWTTDSVMIAGPTAGDIVVPAFSAMPVRFRVDGDPEGVRYRLRLVASRGLPAGGIGADAWESDDLRASAKPLPTDGVARSATLHGMGASADVDWIRLAVDSGTTCRITLVDSSNGMSIAVFDADSIPVPADVSRIGDEVRLAIPADRAGSWWLRLAGRRATRYAISATDSAGIPAWYRRDSWENDDSMARAKKLPAGGAIQARTLHGNPGGTGDVDWIRVGVDSGTTLRLVLEAASSLPSHELRDSAGAQLTPETRRGSSGRVETDTLLLPSLRTGDVFLRVAGTASLDSYRVAATLVPGVPSWMLPEPGEPDSGIATAGAIPELPSVLDRRLVPGDVDWIRVRVPAWSRVIVTARTLASGRGNAWIQPLDAAGRPVGDSSSLQGTASMVLDASSLTDSVAYLRVRGSVDSGAMLPYELRDSVVHYVPDSCEPNQDRAHATALAGSDAYLSNPVTSRFDDDWYTFDASAGEVVRFDAWCDSQSLSVDLFEGDQPRRTGDTARVAGTWFAHVRGSATKVSSYRLFMERLVVQIVASDSTREGATRIPADGQSALGRFSRGQTRWLRFDMHAGHTYVLQLRSENYTGGILPSVILIQNAKGDSIGALGGRMLGWWAEARENGQAYIRLSQEKDTADFTQRLSLYEIPFDPDSLLPKGTPRLLSTDSSWSPRYYNPPGDTDVFEIKVRAGYGYNLLSDAYGDRNWGEVLDAKGAPFINLLGVSTASFRATYDGSIFVRKVWDLGYPDNCWYRIAAKEYPPSVLEPPHATAKDAQPLSLGDSVGFTLLGTESRIYTLALDSGAEVRFSGDGESGIYLRLTDKWLVQSERDWKLADLRRPQSWTAPAKMTLYLAITQSGSVGLSKGWFSVSEGGKDEDK